MRKINLLCFYAFLVCMGSLVQAANSDADSADIENKVKAAYLSKFVNYVEWPASTFPKPDAPVIIGVINSGEIAAELNGLKINRPANSRPFDVRILRAGESFSGVQLVFIGKGEGGRLKRVLDSVQSQPVLTVTEVEGALNMGSMINFILINDRIRFEVSTVSAENSNIKISARLINVANNVAKNVEQKNESRSP